MRNAISCHGIFASSQRDFRALLAGLEPELEHPSAVEVHLVHARHRDHAEGRAELDPGSGLFSVSRSAACAVVSSFSMKPAGSVRVAVARLDGAPAREELASYSGIEPTTRRGF